MNLKKTYGLRNPEYYRGVFLEIWKCMEVGEEYMEVREETAMRVLKILHQILHI